MQKKQNKNTKKRITPNNVSPVKAKSRKKKAFPVVAIGSSAGGLEAALELFKHLSPQTGMAFIYVQHLSPHHKSLITSILSRITKMEVQEIENMEHMVPNNVYVIPNDKDIEVTDGHIKLIRRSESSAAVSIDVLFSSLAETHKSNVIGVVLSGNAHDGTAGLSAIKAAGGVTFAQDDSAQAKSMPRSAVASGAVDFVLSPKEIAVELNRFGKTGLLRRGAIPPANEVIRVGREILINDNDPHLRKVLELLRKEINVDFSQYKIATIKRRINHRMMQCGITTLKEYAKLIGRENKETHLLYKDLLINITSFFRDMETFQHLKTSFLPLLLKSKAQSEVIRIWVPACSTGEEAYSIAMLIAELQANKAKKVQVQIFATDLSDRAIQDARAGEYSEPDLKLVTKKRIERFFTKTGDTYRVAKEIRDACVFATHNILSDPPFSRIDFISCRNLLIYLDTTAQKKALATISFALNDGGYLLLGKSETVGTASQLFNQVRGPFKLYMRKKHMATRKAPELALRAQGKPSILEKTIRPLNGKKSVVASVELDRVIDSTLLSFYMPACVVINKSKEIIKFRGQTSLYLTHPPGNANLNILKMTRPEFAFELRNAIHEVIKTGQPVLKSGIELDTGEKDRNLIVISIDVRPLVIEWGEPLYLIVFSMQHTERFTGDDPASESHSKMKDRRISKQVEELQKASAEMSLVIESQDRAYEELQAANEEIISVSEEFQTLNEELETSKEEIEATNEELLTTNQELQMRNEQLAESYSFSEAVAETMHEPMIILDKHLRIKSANKAFYKKFHVMQANTQEMFLFDFEDHLLDTPSLRELLDKIVQKDTYIYDHEIVYTFPKTGQRIMLLNARRIEQKNNEQIILLTFTETTMSDSKSKSDNVQLIEALKSRTKALEQTNKVIREQDIFLERSNSELQSFTFISSHDLQEPLRKIRMFASSLLAEENINLSGNGQEYLRKVEATANRMQTLIDDLLIYSGLRERMEIVETTDLNRVASEVIDEFRDVIRAKSAVITLQGDCTADVVKFQFHQLMHNLIDNALKFSHPSRFPRILIKFRVTSGRLLKYDGLRSDVNYCHMSITDNGIGFELQYQDRIFEVFQRLNGRNQYSGTGIGLAMCKRIVENHNGKIVATGKLNKGSQFDICIPILSS